MPVSSLAEKAASSAAWAAAASATVWKMSIGQPMHSIRWRIMTRMVVGYLCMISLTDISGLMAGGIIHDLPSSQKPSRPCQAERCSRAKSFTKAGCDIWELSFRASRP